MSQEEDWLIDDSNDTTEQHQGPAWHVLIVDDEPDIHRVTQLALSGIDFLSRPLKLHSCYSGKEAIDFLQRTPDIALILLDVVMESEDAGLKTARAIREQLGNRQVRIILRTGQPGVAPEREVIESYDINDYKAKTELTRDKLYTAVLGTLRSYNDIMLIDQQRQMLDANRRGLLKVIEASSVIFQQSSIAQLAQGVLEQLQSLLFFEQDALYVIINGGVAALSDNDAVRVLYATGGHSQLRGKTLPEADLARFRPTIDQAVEQARSVYADDHFVGFFKTPHGPVNLFIIEGPVSLSHGDRDLIDMFCSNVSIAYENLLMAREIEETQRTIIYQLSEVVEYRSQDTGQHIRRMAEYSYLIAKAMGLDEEEANIIRTAAPLHDIGKVGIPDAVLLKPGPLTGDERKIMDNHAEIGYTMLKAAKPRILKMAATIAQQHHEKWDGTGYPQKLSGEAIHIAGRITALADVYDALANKRCYKEAWPTEAVLEEIRKMSGSHLDPAVVDAFFKILHEIEAVRLLYHDNAAAH